MADAAAMISFVLFALLSLLADLGLFGPLGRTISFFSRVIMLVAVLALWSAPPMLPEPAEEPSAAPQALPQSHRPEPRPSLPATGV